ncbi:pur operon repressor [Caldalkalibacillus salinus]|uniref:pur operon repressor n=1 Tax=Caldalkalibacillus salinus TaxID=2803787 RepID=UPI001924997B|nr:pur operon repressor [Caldalkalibacillus salinus]
MKKLRRSARIADMTQYLLERPRLLLPLTLFSERYGSAKSSISEDLQIIKDVFVMEGVGDLETVPGAAGGVKFLPDVHMAQVEEWMQELMQGLRTEQRMLPGGYLYLSDYLHQPQIVNKIGKIFGSLFAAQDVDCVMTVETKGIPLAYATAQVLNVPIVIARRDTKVMEGSVVSINYVSGSSKRIQTMSLSRRALPESSKVVIVDDFMKAGGTIRGMMDLLQEFKAEVVGACVFMESDTTTHRIVDEVYSLIRFNHDEQVQEPINLTLGNIFDKHSDKG